MNSISSVIKIKIATLQIGDEFIFDPIIFSEKEIIDFAIAYDPLPFHTDPEFAKTTSFKALIASGPHLFNHFYKRDWCPVFYDTIICGMSFDKWRFLKPVYVNQQNNVKVEVIEKKENWERKSAKVRWKITFLTNNNEIVQDLEMQVLHKLD
jgi:acyl dehydratase